MSHHLRAARVEASSDEAHAAPRRPAAVATPSTQLGAAQELMLNARLKAMAGIARALADAGPDLRPALEVLTRQVAELLGGRCVVHLLSDDGQRLEPVAVYHLDPGVLAAMRDRLSAQAERGAGGLTALVMRTGQPVRLPVARAQPTGASGELQATTSLGGPGAAGVLLVPVRGQGRRLGVLGVARESPGLPYDAEDQTFLEALADQISLAVGSARLRRALDEQERELAAAAGRLLDAQEEERHCIAYDIHDGLAQVATGAYQHLQAYADHHRPRSGEDAAEFERVVGLARRTVEEARRIVANLRPTALEDSGLGHALGLEVEELRAAGWQVRYDDALGAARLPPAVEVALFRVAQEAFSNMRKHAGTTRARVTLGRLEQTVRLEVQDWGRGFESNTFKRHGGPGEHLGLLGMRERIASLGGHCTVESYVGIGTRVIAEIPLLAAMDGARRDA